MKILLAFIAGAVVALAFCWFAVYPRVVRDKIAFGHGQGYVSAQIDIAHKIRYALGDDYQRGEPAQSLYGVKDATVLVVTRNGVKTLRVCCD